MPLKRMSGNDIVNSKGSLQSYIKTEEDFGVETIGYKAAKEYLHESNS